jgi:alkylhydroperoxidase family enzyme
MADHYYVNDNAQANGDHEVHKDGCGWLALAHSKTYLGYFATCREAVETAKLKYRQSNGCAYCATACHTG